MGGEGDGDKIRLPFVKLKYESGQEAVERQDGAEKERQIYYEMARILRDRVAECRRREGVNHAKKCVNIYEAYMRHVRPDLTGGERPAYLELFPPQFTADKYPRSKYDV